MIKERELISDMKITRVRIINFFGISEFIANKVGKLNMITGDNGVGKTSILKAIKEAFRSSGVDPRLIRNDADEAEIMIEIDGNIMAERMITATDNKVKVTENGITKPSPANFLAELLGPFIFNPVEFFLAKPKERRKLFLSAIEFMLNRKEIESTLNGDGELIEWDELDFQKHGLEVLETLQTQIYNKRHLQNQDATRLQKALEQDKREIPDTFDTEKFTDFDFSAQHGALVEANRKISAHEAEAERLDNLRNDAKRIADDIEDKKQKILELTDELQNLECYLSDINTKGKGLAKGIKAFEKPDIEAMEAAIDEYNTSQELIAKLKEIGRREEEHKELKAAHERLDNLHKRLTTTIPQQLLAMMELPIEGISISGDQIKCDGIDIDNLSASEQIQFSMDVARALAGELKVICVDRLESLSTAKIKKFREAAEGSGDEFQYFTTQVTDGPLEMKSSDAKEKATSKSDSKKKTTKRKSTTKKKSDDGKQTEVEF
jgi:uncharacterized protein YoxC